MAVSFLTLKFSNWNICFLQRKYSSICHLEKYSFATAGQLDNNVGLCKVRQYREKYGKWLG